MLLFFPQFSEILSLLFSLHFKNTVHVKMIIFVIDFLGSRFVASRFGLRTRLQVPLLLHDVGKCHSKEWWALFLGMTDPFLGVPNESKPEATRSSFFDGKGRLLDGVGVRPYSIFVWGKEPTIDGRIIAFKKFLDAIVPSSSRDEFPLVRASVIFEGAPLAEWQQWKNLHTVRLDFKWNSQSVLRHSFGRLYPRPSSVFCLRCFGDVAINLINRILFLSRYKLCKGERHCETSSRWRRGCKCAAFNSESQSYREGPRGGV